MLRLPRQAPLLAGAAVHAILLIGLFCWAPKPRGPDQAPLLYLVAALWGLGSALNKTSLSTLLGMLYQDKERQDFVFTIYHWWQALAIFVVYLWSGLPMKVSGGCSQPALQWGRAQGAGFMGGAGLTPRSPGGQGPEGRGCGTGAIFSSHRGNNPAPQWGCKDLEARA
uniref:Uncharacterized protein n=1 Tax=Terrapene triunguis TaxID=2587831 RepID=A0A674IWJ9_9SAUR